LRDTSATIYLAWEDTRVPLKLEVDTVGMLMPKIKAAIDAEGPKTWNFYNGAASLLYDNGGDLDQALAWVNESIKLRADYPGNLLLKTRILKRLGRNEEAKETAAKTVEAGKKLEGPDSVMARQAKDISDGLK
jgi:tetratricopeptide (TPR) repeat protein